MKDLVEKYIVVAGFEKDVTYFKEMYLKDIEEKVELLIYQYFLIRVKERRDSILQSRQIRRFMVLKQIFMVAVVQSSMKPQEVTRCFRRRLIP